MAHRAAGELETSGMVATDAKGKVSVSPWFTIHAQATKGLAGLALRLRIGPQSRAPKAPKTKAAPTSYYDRMSLGDGSRGATGRADAD